MIKFRFIPLAIFLAASSSIMVSCGDDDDEQIASVGNVTVAVSPEALVAGPEAATLPLEVEANSDWSISCESDWVSIRPSGGIKNTPVTTQITVKKNDAMEERVAVINITSGGKVVKSVNLTQGYEMKAEASVQTIMMSGAESSTSFTITANCDWTLETSGDWVTITPTAGGKGETQVILKASANSTSSDREAEITLAYGGATSNIKVSQLSDAIHTPDGYHLVWSDEFNGGPTLGKEWVAENWPAGYVNNELQIYTSRTIDGKSTLEVKDGFLNINCFKASDGKIYSGRVNAMPSTGWLYGYFEARINLPKGKGTWPAFWMMPCNVDWGKNPWPLCGEIDIMEEVGADPNYVSSSLHTENYNHTKGTQKTHEMYCAGAEGEFHIYACEWTEDEIITYVDGKVQLRASRASMGTDHASWPFHYAFYPILNLAWGGDWGGYKGVDDNALPVTMKVDYVRIFQKN